MKLKGCQLSVISCDPAVNLPYHEYYHLLGCTFPPKNCLVFASHDTALESVDKWADLNFCPLTKARSNKASITKTNVKMRARRDFKCSHGMKYSARGGAKRPWQRVKYTGCKVRSNYF